MVKLAIKILAAVLMIASGYFFGKSLEEKLKERYETLNKLSLAVYFLKSKIYTEGFTLPEALKVTDDKYLKVINHYFLWQLLRWKKTQIVKQPG